MGGWFCTFASFMVSSIEICPAACLQCFPSLAPAQTETPNLATAVRHQPWQACYVPPCFWDLILYFNIYLPELETRQPGSNDGATPRRMVGCELSCPKDPEMSKLGKPTGQKVDFKQVRWHHNADIVMLECPPWRREPVPAGCPRGSSWWRCRHLT